jgi:NAD(P)-dependent dehydrogenase (short-subunit alcohol dehydrogenase family)
MQGKQVLITGSTQGIGRAAALALARLGAEVTVHGRDSGRAGAVADEIRAASGNPKVDFLAFDLSSLAETRQAAERYRSSHPKLDVLCLNAGVFLAKRELSAEGFEKTLATRFLGHFLLAQSLLPSLQASGEGRVVTTAAPPNGFSVDWDNLGLEKHYSTFKAVMQAMGALLMFNLELAERFRGQGITANFFHPGIIDTHLLDQMPWIMRAAQSLLGAPVEKGADTLVYLASDPSLRGVSGQYFNKRQSKPFKGAIASRQNQARAWAEGMKMTGLG